MLPPWSRPVFISSHVRSSYTAVPAAQFVVAMVGAVTALFAATIAVGQFDIKKYWLTPP